MIGMKKPHQRMLSSFSSSVKTPLSGNVNQSMTTYANVNGKSISTTKHIANGVETVSIFENGKLVKKTINGVEQQIEHAKSKEVPHITQAHKGAPKQQVRQHHIKVQHQPAQEADRQVNRSQYNAATHRTTHNPQRHNQQQEQRRRYQSEARPRRFTTVVEANHTPQKKQPSSRATSSQRVFHGMPTRIANVCQDNAVASDPNNRSRWFKDFKIR